MFTEGSSNGILQMLIDSSNNRTLKYKGDRQKLQTLPVLRQQVPSSGNEVEPASLPQSVSDRLVEGEVQQAIKKRGRTDTSFSPELFQYDVDNISVSEEELETLSKSPDSLDSGKCLDGPRGMQASLMPRRACSKSDLSYVGIRYTCTWDVNLGLCTY